MMRVGDMAQISKMPETRGLGPPTTVPAGMMIKRRFKCSCESLPFQGYVLWAPYSHDLES